MTVTEAAAFLREHDNYLILTHKRPDGDTIGCAAGLCRGLRGLGKTAHICPGTGAHPHLPALSGGPHGPGGLRAGHGGQRGHRGPQPCSPTPAGPGWSGGWIWPSTTTPPRSSSRARPAWTPAGAACGELIYDILKELGPVTAHMAAPLYVAIATDTGCFQYSSTTAATHRTAAALMDTGLDVFPLNKKHFRTKTWPRLQVERLIVERMHRYDGGKIAVAPVSLSLMEEAGAVEGDMEDIAAFLGQIEGVETSVTIPGAGGGRLQAVRPHRRGAQRLVGMRPAGGRRPRRRRRLHRARRPGRGRGRHFGRHPAGTGGGVGADIIRPRSR